MKAFLFVFPALPALTVIALAQAQPEPPPPPPVYVAPSPAQPNTPGTTENQRLYGPSSDTLIARETAGAVVEKFRNTYAAANAPRIVIYVNRELVDLTSGLKLTGHTEKYDETATSAKSDLEATAGKGSSQSTTTK